MWDSTKGLCYDHINFITEFSPYVFLLFCLCLYMYLFMYHVLKTKHSAQSPEQKFDLLILIKLNL